MIFRRRPRHALALRLGLGLLLLFVALPGPRGETGAQETIACSARLHIDRTATIVVSSVHKDAKKHFPRAEALAKYLAAQLRDLGIERGAAVVAMDLPEMIGLLDAGCVDLVSETVFAAIHLSRQSDADFLLLEWKKGVAEYRSVFVTQIGNDIESIADLRGRRIAFEDRGSTSGFLLPLAILRQAGLNPREVSPRTPPVDGAVTYSFADEEINIAAWVVQGIADAGAISNQDWEDILRTPGPLKDQLRIFHSSEPVPRSIILARGGLDAQIKARVRRLLLSMLGDPAGKAVLEVYNDVTRYEEIVSTVAADIARAGGLYDLVAEAMN